ncbi:hypothetical protein AKJ09_02368 [Labilithrix luteola]|uniref:Uncharacterized protein n=1 Tax=Labilithrix luteola TaxID=1391654 RepID=A0A0K1PRH7_9BACT|nr:hypothetical protein [Labilithrix luteola]AKU95704.1 hypothetical protein AKJ09_02368 [Labilithrix luteola]
MDLKNLERLVEDQLANIEPDDVRAALTSYVVRPTCQLRRWDYGSEGERFPCWLVARFHESRTGIAYCEHGFGPEYAWGVVGLGDDAMGTDAAWHVSLEQAFRNSAPWAGRNPSDYEVP